MPRQSVKSRKPIPLQRIVIDHPHDEVQGTIGQLVLQYSDQIEVVMQFEPNDVHVQQMGGIPSIEEVVDEDGKHRYRIFLRSYHNETNKEDNA